MLKDVIIAAVATFLLCFAVGLYVIYENHRLTKRREQEDKYYFKKIGASHAVHSHKGRSE